MGHRFRAVLLTSMTLPLLSGHSAEPPAQPVAVNQPPTAKDWANLAKLPDWSGVWNPNITDQFAQMKTNPPPWNPKAAARTAHMFAEEKAGRPPPIFVNCLPRIYTDGRPHPDNPDPTFHGHSIGHWEGGTLVVDTVAVHPQAYIAISEAVGVPNNGEMRIIERIHLQGPDILQDDLEIIAPKVLTKPWKTTRVYFRQRARKYDIVEGVCLEGSFAQRTDEDGYATLEPIRYDVGGNRIPPK